MNKKEFTETLNYVVVQVNNAWVWLEHSDDLEMTRKTTLNLLKFMSNLVDEMSKKKPIKTDYKQQIALVETTHKIELMRGIFEKTKDFLVEYKKEMLQMVKNEKV